MAFNGPLIAKLEAWGYEKKFSAPVAELISSLDSPSLALVERLSNDLTHLTERSHDLRVQVAALSDSLNHERHRAEQFAVDNEKLLQDKDELSRKLQELTDITNNLNTGGNEEEQVQLWRAQSMHQLQELESMNEALRETLNLHSCCAPHAPQSNTPPLKGKAKGCKQRPQNVVNAADVKCKLLEDEVHLWKEKHSLLEEKLRNVQKELAHIMETRQTLSAVARHGEERQSAQHSPKVDVGMNTEEASNKLEAEEKESNLQGSYLEYCSVMDDLLCLFQVRLPYLKNINNLFLSRDYEKELIGLAASHLSEIDILRRQRTSNKQLCEVSITDQDYLDNVMQDVLGQLELKVMNVTGAHETYL
ncbi:hypothetical protein R1sor_004674 [Riccia sorocarpa]|uniref:Centrosomal protein of 70 kDa n=1 Tax=Riccia sorocarpa TaxID=122646 RepID=A0ABD3HHC5_9MARC